MPVVQPNSAIRGKTAGGGGDVGGGAASGAIELTHVGKCYRIYDRPRDRLKQALFGGWRAFGREFWALRDVTLEIGRGETVGIIGRNGSGKSTLLQIICGTLSPTTGQVKTAGRVAALLELGSGFHPEFTGRENVYMNAQILGLTREQTDARFDRIAAFADIGAFLDRPVKTYSSGMFVRLAFSVVAHVDADVLVIDEALAVGDAFFTQKCIRFLRGFRERGGVTGGGGGGGTLCFVSHDAGAVAALCERAVWLEGGKVRQMGTAKAVNEAYLAELLGDVSRQRAQENGGADAARNGSGGVLGVGRRAELAVTPVRDVEDSFGEGGARILGADVVDAAGNVLQGAVAGMAATVRVHFRALRDLRQPIVGFYVKDRLGQNLFGQNTQWAYAENPPPMMAGEERVACFSFEMPLLQAGSYTLAVAVADGTTEQHTQHHWIHDAYVLTAPQPTGPGSAAGGVAAGLVGIPMKRVEFCAPLGAAGEDHQDQQAGQATGGDRGPG